MIFEVIGEITDTEVIAVGSRIHDIERLRKNFMAQDGGGSSRALRWSAWRMERNPLLNYIGMKRMAWAKRK